MFVGVNGVGKSTNLAKVAYWLLQNDISVGMLEPFDHRGCPLMSLHGLPLCSPCTGICPHHARLVMLRGVGMPSGWLKCHCRPPAGYNLCFFKRLSFGSLVFWITYRMGLLGAFVNMGCISPGFWAIGPLGLPSHGMTLPCMPGNVSQVMIAACDTFRSGAVEQLKTHCARLGVPLYERGYEKDPAKVLALTDAGSCKGHMPTCVQ